MELFRRRTRRPTLDLDDIQATVLRARPEPYFGTHAIIEITDQAAGRQLLRRLAPLVSSAARWDEPRSSWMALAISYAGLVALGVPQDSLESFPANFRAGMAARADRLRDTGPNAPQHWEAPWGSGRAHLAVSVYADNEDDWRGTMAGYERQLQDLAGVRLLSHQDFGATGFNVFGYRDGFSQPVVEGSGAEPLPGDGRPIKAGEFVLGYPSETGQPLPMPTPDVLGRNGTYVVFRKYHSHVATFNRYLRDNASTEEDRELLAAKLVGRWRSGAPLALTPEQDDPAVGADPRRINDFDYTDDPRGLRTPLGSHIRRMNPRSTKLETLSDVNIRRIIRRSTSFGEPVVPTVLTADGADRGLDFIALGARAIDNVEFLQSEWVNSGNFVGLGKEKDPMISLQDKGAYFTVPGSPPRRVHGIQSFNTLRGGEYLFMPSLSAIHWLAG
ncbi:Dyp-type peroxidase domain-containing protein [Kutzneria buriramensis]|uniref:Dyp-type peroxidase family n=1 Tax=Kutzneria buriramensis TaxID=1045776 RepID=A0A3E0HPX3_9PSEU|nr:Dyp-type peroxidase domain-containing protein [Kutzneria buriramensis]REH48441.1 Dyp-type peroxidase family [Kutzneria buriramensis]